MTLPVSLAAAAETLRACMCGPTPATDGYVRGCPEHDKRSEDAKRWTAVADLIDGMLAEHAKWSEKACDVGLDRDWVMDAQSKEEAYDDVLALLVPVVRAFLPDWNPDTEETLSGS